VANVSDAMKKHQAEQAAGAAPAGARPGTPVPLAPEAAPLESAPVGPISRNGYDEVLVAHHDRGSSIAEHYRSLRTNLLAQYLDERFCLLITSAEKSEGKTVTCLNLALVLGERQERSTVVVDGDLRKCRVAEMLRIGNEPGLADLLRGTARVEDVVRPTAYRNVFVIPAGKADENEVGELLHRPELGEIVGELRRRYDYVLFDTPPITIKPDAGTLGQAVHEAILVVRMYKTHRETADNAIRLLHAANVKPVGVVLTHHKYYIPKCIYYRM
jgi:capsular exopolysaccharide synthesis family protein